MSIAWKKKLFQRFKLYAITDLRKPNPNIARDCESAYRGGADIIQLRSKCLCDRELYKVGVEIKKIASKLKRLLIINDRIDLALAIGADGVHLGQEDIAVPVARKLIGSRRVLIGKSTHSFSQAIKAAQEGADYIGFGPIFKTPTKPTYHSVGLCQIRKVTTGVAIPVVCIGGIHRENITQVLESGASRVAVVRAIFDQKDKKQAALELKRILTYDN